MIQSNKKGFTIIELLIVIAIVAILLALVMASFDAQRKKSRDNVRISDIQTIRLALDNYRLSCGEFPEALELTANNGCQAGVSFADFIGNIPQSPSYSSTNQPSSLDYFYAGLSTSPGGRCYEYHIATQLEYGADNDFGDGEQSQFLDSDHDFAQFQGKYDKRCRNSDLDFDNADDDTYGLYDFRSTKHDF